SRSLHDALPIFPARARGGVPGKVRRWGAAETAGWASMRGASGKKRVVRLVRVTRSERVVYAIRAGAGSHAYELVRTVLSAPPPWSTHGLRGGLDGGSSGGEGGNAAGCARA